MPRPTTGAAAARARKSAPWPTTGAAAAAVKSAPRPTTGAAAAAVKSVPWPTTGAAAAAVKDIYSRTREEGHVATAAGAALAPPFQKRKPPLGMSLARISSFLARLARISQFRRAAAPRSHQSVQARSSLARISQFRRASLARISQFRRASERSSTIRKKSRGVSNSPTFCFSSAFAVHPGRSMSSRQA